MKDIQDQFNVLRKVQKKPEASQRELAKDLGFSLGKLNYCVKALQKKVYQDKKFSRKKNKIKYNNMYLLLRAYLREQSLL